MKGVRIPLFTRARMAGETPECVTELPEPRDVRVFDLVFTPDGPGMMMKQRGKYFEKRTRQGAESCPGDRGGDRNCQIAGGSGFYLP